VILAKSSQSGKAGIWERQQNFFFNLLLGDLKVIVESLNDPSKKWIVVEVLATPTRFPFVLLQEPHR
jgi:hypothetical protein